MGVSSAVGSERISRIVGYILTKGDFSNTSPNLPQRVAILGEANEANQGILSTTPVNVTTLKQAGDLYGYGSPIYNMVRILRPTTGSGIGGIPTIVYPQSEAGSAVAAARDVTPSGTATKNTTHTVVINGRSSVDGGRYDFAVATGDEVGDLVPKIISAINAVLGSPVIATDGTGKVTLTTKWAGLTSEKLTVTIDNNGDAAALSYAVVSSAVGSATPSVAASLALFGSEWNTIVLNPYGAEAFTELEDFNGVPDPDTPTGRYQGIVMKPFVALYGDTAVDPSTLTNVTARKTQVTNASCPAPNSAAFPMEAAANMCTLFARVEQDTPHLDVNAKFYPDMPIPSDGDIGLMSVYNNRDAIVKKGGSTVDLVAGRYQVQDFVTTYHPDGEIPPQFRYARNLMLDFNVRYGYYLLEQINVVDKTIANDADTISVGSIIKPKQWKQIIAAYANDLAKRALIADPDFMVESIIVALSGTNPDRLDTFFRYKRTGIARISSTTAEAGFNFGEA